MTFVRALVPVLATVTIAAVTSGCGGSSSPESVNGCAIQAGTSCSGADLSGADLAGADLSGADLSTSSLEGTNLSDANLSAANLSGAQMVDTDLSNADLTRANLTGATITGTNLDGATLCGTVRTDGTIDDSSCPAATDTTNTTDTTDTETTTTEATVTSFEVGDLDCSSGATTGSVAVSWTTEATTAVELSVEGQLANTSGPPGSAGLQVPCDGETHEVSITPRDDSGSGEAESQEVSSG